VVGEGGDDVDDALEDQEPGQHDRDHDQRAARPDGGDDPAGQDGDAVTDFQCSASWPALPDNTIDHQQSKHT
jgi:hypothetical protein